MRKLSLFSGVGGIDLAAHWAGMETVAFCERESFPQKVLRKHWPNVPIYDDVCTLTAEKLKEDGIIGPGRAIDIISAGFPCQPFSNAGKREGTDDERYLWPEVVRVLAENEPPWFVGENVAGILSMAEPDGAAYVESRVITRSEEEDFLETVFTQQEIMLIGRICQDLKDISYEVEIYVLPAAAVGSSHPRERVFILGHSERFRRNRESRRRTDKESQDGHCRVEGGVVGDTTIQGFSERRQPGFTEDGKETGSGMEPESKRSGKALANSKGRGRPAWRAEQSRQQECHAATVTDGTRHSARGAIERTTKRSIESRMGRSSDEFSAWLDGRGINPLDTIGDFIANYPQPALLGMPQYDWEPPRVAIGVKDRVGRLKALGNAVNPVQIYPILAAIKAIDDLL